MSKGSNNTRTGGSSKTRATTATVSASRFNAALSSVFSRTNRLLSDDGTTRYDLGTIRHGNDVYKARHEDVLQERKEGVFSRMATVGGKVVVTLNGKTLKEFSYKGTSERVKDSTFSEAKNYLKGYISHKK